MPSSPTQGLPIDVLTVPKKFPMFAEMNLVASPKLAMLLRIDRCPSLKTWSNKASMTPEEGLMVFVSDPSRDLLISALTLEF